MTTFGCMFKLLLYFFRRSTVEEGRDVTRVTRVR